MSYNYTKPENVISPKSKIKGTPKVLFDGGIGDNCFSVAIVNWDGKDAFGIRWNIAESEWGDPEKKEGGSKQCKGNPLSRGRSTWFIVPDALFDPSSPVMLSILEKIK